MDWTKQARGILKAELARRNVSYKQLVKALERIGVDETAHSVAQKLSRGTFSFQFFLQCAASLRIGSMDFSLLLADVGRSSEEASRSR